MSREDAKRIEEIRAWFDERSYELYVHEIEGEGWRAPYLPKGSPIGSADYGVGQTALQAAEDAKARLGGGRAIFAGDEGVGADSASVTIHAPAAEARASIPAPTVLIQPEVVHERALGEPKVKAQPREIPDLEKKVETLNTYGWRLAFEDEPDGKVTGYLLDADSGKTIRSTIGHDFQDAWLNLGIDTMPPSQEVRREREARRSEDPGS